MFFFSISKASLAATPSWEEYDHLIVVAFLALGNNFSASLYGLACSNQKPYLPLPHPLRSYDLPINLQDRQQVIFSSPCKVKPSSSFSEPRFLDYLLFIKN